jgi:hypothetical protein
MNLLLVFTMQKLKQKEDSMQANTSKAKLNRFFVILFGMIMILGTVAVGHVWAAQYRTITASLKNPTPHPKK